MRIALLNGSPKVKNSASGTLLEDLKGYLEQKAEVVNFGFHSAAITEETIGELAKTDAWVFAFPFMWTVFPDICCPVWCSWNKRRYKIPKCAFTA